MQSSPSQEAPRSSWAPCWSWLRAQRMLGTDGEQTQSRPQEHRYRISSLSVYHLLDFIYIYIIIYIETIIDLSSLRVFTGPHPDLPLV